jgi:two-component system chemotaxis response regulator CheB
VPIATELLALDPHRPPPSLVMIAASAGGFLVLQRIIRELPSTFPIPVIALLHIAPTGRSMLRHVLARGAALRVKEAEDGDALRAGVVYVAPANWHLLVEAGGRLQLSKGAFVHYVRPAADSLFESAAATFGCRAVAIVLSGSGIDGATGAAAIHEAGGAVIVQDPREAQFPSMPLAAIDTGAADYVLPAEAIAPLLLRMMG